VVFSSETPDSTSWNKNLASDSPRGKPTRRYQVINRADAQTKGYCCVTPGIKQFLNIVIHGHVSFALDGRALLTPLLPTQEVFIMSAGARSLVAGNATGKKLNSRVLDEPANH
jgi:hypothetical protein